LAAGSWRRKMFTRWGHSIPKAAPKSLDVLLLDFFKAVLIDDSQKSAKKVVTTYITRGILLDFEPTPNQAKVVESFIRENKIRTLFSVDEVDKAGICDKIVKQLAHYAVSYWFESPELIMNIEGVDHPLSFIAIRGLHKSQIQKFIDTLLYSNRPGKDTDGLVRIIRELDLQYHFDEIKNNELRIQLFDQGKDVFSNGDDAVRYIVFQCTNSPLLIKSRQVIETVQVEHDKIRAHFLQKHVAPLSECFNRHKRIIMALKVGTSSRKVKTIINQIAHLSKKNHKPIGLSKNKTFISDSLQNTGGYNFANLEKFSVRDKFKFLNLLQFKKLRLREDIFVIRNGRTWAEAGRPIFKLSTIAEVEAKVLDSIGVDLQHLKHKKIVLPKDIDYGLPISRKQSLGHLPFGTKVKVTSDEISSGVYWKNDWGARDLDLSTIDKEGNRTGWGRMTGYDRGNPVTFSGDIVNAPNGAMEFMTSSDASYGLFVNIYNGELGCECEVLVGKKSKERWINTTTIREKCKLPSRGNVIGFVNGKEYTVFLGRLNESRASFNTGAIILAKAKSYYWTVTKLLDEFDIAWTSEELKKPDHNLSYEGFTFEKLEQMFTPMK
jgi:hypothetical protein